MNLNIDIAEILTPIPGENPAGIDLKYDVIYDEIKNARKADDQLDRGDWQRDLKTADWQKVTQVSLDALTQKTKDLQIAVWLTEGLIKTTGFSGLSAGLKVINGFLMEFWSSFYPEIDDGDLEYRSGPLEFLNDKLWLAIKQIPLTDKSKAAEYSWIDWQESRQVGYEKDAISPDGDVDEKKQARRNAALAEGKLAPEDFDKAIALTSEDFYRTQVSFLKECQEEFTRLDTLIDEKFGKEAPSLVELDKAFTDCGQFFKRLFKDKGWDKVIEEIEEETTTEQNTGAVDTVNNEDIELQQTEKAVVTGEVPAIPQETTMTASDSQELGVWDSAVALLKSNDIDAALALLFGASCRALSVRQKNRYRLYMAKLCLKASRVDLAKPILEELNTLIEELQLERWESPTWVGEVLEALYQCLTSTDERFQDPDRASELLKKLCTTDVTRAMNYKT